MVLTVCVDEKMGMRFNRRRVSRDVEVCRDMLRLGKMQPLYIEEQSVELFKEWPDCFHKTLDGKVPAGALFFAEDPDSIFEDDVEEIVLYRWNRRYPADQYFPIDLAFWNLVESIDFQGYSHERITRERYRRQ